MPEQGGSRFSPPAVAAVLVVALAVMIVVGVVAWKARAEVVAGTALPADAAGPGVPAGVTANGAIRIGDPGAKVVVRVVMDLQCPACRRFEKANGAVLERAAKSGTAAVEYNVISFLDRASTTEYSSRAGNAAFCVAASGSANFQKWLETMFEEQPAEGGAGLPDSKLIDMAKGAGYTDSAVAQCITGRQYDQFLDKTTKDVLAGDVKGTPTVFINGKKVDSSSAIYSEGGLGPVIESAAR
ncbi:DsbA family protein [Nocardia sp. NPDC052566]|uniref:DsbA family protein n=1 Tax=Nocardia sp. NPDC052566 TaxID=3364330 RepID=UPI0037CB3968